MQINAAKSAIQNILDLVVDANPSVVITPAQVTIGAPSVVSGTAGRNTEVTLTAVGGQGKTGSKTVAYTRLNPVTGPNASQATSGINTAVDATDVQVKSALVALFGLVDAEVEVSALVLPTEGVPGSITLAAKADSLLYVGETSVKLVTPDVEEDLGEEIVTSDLDGFEPAV